MPEIDHARKTRQYPTMKRKVLCIEDDPTMQALVEVALADYEVISTPTLKEAERLLQQITPSALIIDIQLPDGDGLRFLTQISQEDKFKKIPVLILSNHTDISYKVMAFSFGAEDFIGKPFDPIELNARLTAKVKRRAAETEAVQNRQVGDLLIDLDRQKVFLTFNGKEKDLGLTGIELKILSLLTRRMEQVYSREQIMNSVWGETFIADRTIDSHVAHLRQKIQETQVQIETAKNLGYRAVLRK